MLVTERSASKLTGSRGKFLLLHILADCRKTTKALLLTHQLHVRSLRS